MPITEKQRKERLARAGGSSESPALCGASKWQQPYDIWALRNLDLKVTPEEEEANRNAKAIGNYQEDGLLSWGADELGITIVRNQYVIGANDVMAAHLDALVVVPGRQIMDPSHKAVMEAKCRGMRDDWGAPYTADVPQDVNFQVQHQMYCKGADLAYVIALLPCFKHMEMILYIVPRDEELIQMICAEWEWFWPNHIVANVPPEWGHMSEEMLGRVNFTPGKIIPVAIDLTDNWLDLRQQRLDISKEEKKAKLHIETLIVEADGGSVEGANYELTYTPTTRKSHGKDPDKYKDHCKECGLGVRESTTRTLRKRKV
jgi:predicted phage-related endonuclease